MNKGAGRKPSLGDLFGIVANFHLIQLIFAKKELQGITKGCFIQNKIKTSIKLHKPSAICTFVLA